MTNNTIRASHALAIINTITSLPDDDCDIAMMIRDILINDESLALPDHPLASIMRDCITALDDDMLSHMRLDYSLCPMHACDYAICFDDDDDECAAIRACFPSHDT